jgi:hypothetical protein
MDRKFGGQFGQSMIFWLVPSQLVDFIMHFGEPDLHGFQTPFGVQERKHHESADEKNRSVRTAEIEPPQDRQKDDKADPGRYSFNSAAPQPSA